MTNPDPSTPLFSTESLTMIGGLIAASAYLTWFIADQFGRNRRLFYRIISRHNKEDDDRFEILDNSIWEIHVRNAMRDGDHPPKRQTIPRRRYLVEDAGEVDEMLNEGGGTEGA